MAAAFLRRTGHNSSRFATGRNSSRCRSLNFVERFLTSGMCVSWRQLLRSGRRLRPNYRAARARSDKEFCANICLVVEEADESQLWIELLPEAHPGIDVMAHTRLLQEATAIFTASHKTARTNMERRTAEKTKARAKNSAHA